MAEVNTGGTPNPDAQSGAGGGQQQAAATTGTGPTSGAAPTGGQQQQAAAAKKFEYAEDRTDWTPRHRLNEESTKRQQAEAKAKELEAALAKEQARVRAALGVEPQDPKAAEQAEVEQVLQGMLKKMYPGIDILSKLTPDQFDRVIKAADVAMQSSEHQWTQHTTAVYDALETETAKQLGVASLTEKQRSQIQRAYVAEAEACMATRQQAAELGQPYDARNDFMARHLRRDPSLVKEFVDGYLGEWFTPAKRTVGAQQQGRRGNRPVPNGGRSQDLTISNQPVGNLDNKDDFKKALLAARNAGG